VRRCFFCDNFKHAAHRLFPPSRGRYLVFMSAQTPTGTTPPPAVARLLGQARTLIEREHFADAIAPLSEAAELLPNNARIQTDLGGLYLETGNTERALEHLCRAIEINPKIAIAHWRIGVALQSLGDDEGAIEALELAVEMQPTLADAHFRLGMLYRGRGRRQEAVDSYRKAAQFATEPAEIKFLQAQACAMEGRQNEAEDLLLEALEIDPNLPTAHGLLGAILSASGRFKEAAKHLEAQIERSPHAGLCYYDLVRSKKITAADEGIVARLDKVLEDPGLSDIDRGVVLLARGKALDDLGRYQEAMKSLDEAAVVRSRTHPFSIEAFENQIDGIISLFNADMLASRVSANTDRTPVLILGMPRSGTTLVEQIVSSHPEVVGSGELAYWRKCLQAVMAEGGADGFSPAFLSGAAEEYLGQLRLVSATAQRVTDKDPFNFLAIGLIHLVFPNAAIVHCRRNPLDSAISIHQTHFSRSAGIPTGGPELVRYFRAYQRLMDHWRRALPAGRLFEVNYENLASSPQGEIMKLISHLGLYWDPACLAPHVNSRVIHTPSGWQVRQSINTGSIGRWRHYEPWLGPLADLKEPAT
jgi:tetratricopeptide (TPR) repeat protein